MKKIFLYFILNLLFTITYSQEAKDIVKKADEKVKGNTSFSSITIQTIRPSWSREITVKAWTKGNDYSAILVVTPAKEKGIVYLKRKKEVWNWIPSIERTIKMPPSMMNQSWMGTDFTNDDLVKEASILEDYNHTFLDDIVITKRICHRIQLLPKPKASVVWGKLIMCIDKKDYLMLHVDYYDEDGKLVNTMVGSDIRILGNRLLPARIEMIPADKKGYKTILLYNSVSYDMVLEDSFFTTQNITRIK